MRRMLTAVIATVLALLALPAIAAAHHGRHHGRHAHKHHATSARIVTFGARSAAASPTAPTTPTSPNEAAGKVVKFEAGVLTIALTGSTETVSGKVTSDTELRCQPATPPGESGDDQDEGDQQSGDQPDEQGPSSASGDFGNGHGDSMAHSADFQDEGGEGNPESCSTTALTPGTEVLEAELELTGTGSVWEKLVIVH